MHPRSVFTTTFKSEETMLVNTGPAVTNCERCIKLSTGYIQELGELKLSRSMKHCSVPFVSGD